jgi:hypothetical protein
LLLEGVPVDLDRDALKDIEGNVAGVREIHHMHIWSLDMRNVATPMPVWRRRDAYAVIVLSRRGWLKTMELIMQRWSRNLTMLTLS